MLGNLLHFILHTRGNFWRRASMSQLGDVYISILIHHLAIGMVAIFVDIYLYNLGFSLYSVLLYQAMFYGFRVPLNYVAAKTVARIGPQHTTAISYAVQVIFLVLLVSFEAYNWHTHILALAGAAATSLYYISFHVDISKVKHAKSEGSELGLSQILGRIGGTVGPLIGGFIASLYDIRLALGAAALMFVVGVVPLLRDKEPTKTHQKIRFSTLPLTKLSRDLIVAPMSYLEIALNVSLWPLFIAVIVLGGEPYAEIGVLSALGVLISIAATQAVGKLTDKKRGRSLLRVSSVLLSAVNFSRIFVGSYTAALGVNMVYEAASPGRNIPMFKGMYDKADLLEGNRITYLTVISFIADSLRALAFVLLSFMALFYGEYTAFTIGFIITALAALVIRFERYEALNS